MGNKNLNSRYTFVDLFAGIGGFRIALEKAGGKCLGFSEIDREAVRVYKNNFISEGSGELEIGDITKVKTLPKVDVLVGGVPCQSWSVAGKMKGFEDPRGRLWLDTIRTVKLNKPRAFIFENVKGLIDPRNRKNLELILSSFQDLGYDLHYKLMNSFDFGLPQNRDRIYIVGLRKGLKRRNFEFPAPIRHSAKLHKFLENVKVTNIEKSKMTPDELFGGKIPAGRNRFQKIDTMNDFFVFCDTRNGHTTIHSWDMTETTDREKFICMSIMRNRRKKEYGLRDGNPLSLDTLKKIIPDLKKSELDNLIKLKILKQVKDHGYEFVNSKNSSGINGIYRIYLPESDVFSTLTATGTRDMVATQSISGKTPEEFRKNFITNILNKEKYRRITPKEAARLQGFPSSFRLHEKDNLAHKQFGNAVSVPVVYNVINSVLETGILD